MTPTCTPATGTATHLVTNQPPPLQGYDAVADDPLLERLLAAPELAAVHPLARSLGGYVGSAEALQHASDANRHPPTLCTHDRYGHRIDQVDYHPAYHTLMSVAARHGVHGHAWRDAGAAPFTSRAALVYLWNQLENGTACPLTMTFAGVQVMRNAPALAAVWEPRLTACDYDPRPLPVDAKRAALVGMAMTEKQGGSDLRAVATLATRVEPDWYALTGHKWFCSAPMCDGFFTLARTAEGVTCFFVPRSLPDGARNVFLIQRLKDKVGNRSNASSEIEYRDTLAQLIGEPGRGIATLIEMAHLTRFDIVVAQAGMMRAGLREARHHAQHRHAFGKALGAQPAMQNVLADLELETAAATQLAFRLAAAFDRRGTDPMQELLARILTPIAKYWLCKRMVPFAFEAMECLGGSGYVEESPLARLYREAPLNSLWEGSGNVICLDVLRSLARSPECFEALVAEVARAGNAALTAHITGLRSLLADSATAEWNARRFVEEAAQCMQAALLLQQDEAMGGRFMAARLGPQRGRLWGTLAAP